MSGIIVDCPSGLRVRVGKLKVRQFKLLGNKKALESGEAFEAFLNACAQDIVEPGPAYPDWTRGTLFDWKRALQGDRFLALMGIRRATHGESLDFDVRCSACGEMYGWRVDLGALPVQPYPSESIEAFAAKRDMVATCAGRRVTYRLMTGAEEERLQRHLDGLRRSDRRTRQRDFDPLVEAALARMLSVDPPPADRREWYEDLDAGDMLSYSSELERASGGVETEIETRHEEDPRCGAVTRVELPFGSRDFWMPRRARSSATT